MGLLNKLKNVLFVEEVVEVPVKEEVKKKPEVAAVKKPKINFEPKEDLISDRELFKAEKTFDFPAFDDKEFDDMKGLPKINIEEPKVEEPKSMAINILDHERPKIKKPKEIKTEEIRGRAYQTKKSEFRDTSKFKPSPVISPVYGVLDKNYKKEDLVVPKKEKAIDVDDVRKKAFGTLEEDLEKTLSKPVKKFYNEEKKIDDELPKIKKDEDEEKSIEDLLEETAYDVIDLPKEDLDYDDKDVEPIEDDVLEESEEDSDLFGLIESMYDKKEDE